MGCAQSDNNKTKLKITHGTSSGWDGSSTSKTQTVNVEVGDKLTYELLYDEFTFEIISITDEKIEIKVDKKGLSAHSESGGISLIGSFTEFIIEKGKPLDLSTQTFDSWGDITFEY